MNELILNIPQIKKKDGTALVLSGGATKAFYFHLGVLKVLELNEVTSIVGSSAGSIIGAFIASGASVDTLLTSLYQKQVYVPKFDRWIKTLSSTMLFKPRYGAITKQSLHATYSILRFIAALPSLYKKDIVAEAIDRMMRTQSHVDGFFDSYALEQLFKSLLPSYDFSDTDIDLYVTGTCIDTGIRAVFNGLYDFETDDTLFLTDVPIHKAVRASSAVPGMFEPVLIKGRYYVDGEIKRTLSMDLGVRLADKIIISHTYQPLRSKSGGTVAKMGWLHILKQSLNTTIYERITRWREGYEDRYPEKQFLWIHPEPDDLEFFLAPEFSFKPEIQRKLIRSGELAALKALKTQIPNR